MNNYSKTVHPVFLGLLISFIGTLPLGVLNVLGAYFYQKFGLEYLISFGLGIVVIEVIVLLLIIYLLNWIRNQTQWISILTKGRILGWVLGASLGTMLGLIFFAVLMSAFHEKFVAKLANIDDIIGIVLILYGLFQITLYEIKKGRLKDSP